jgi:hypothetical protein
MASSLYFKTLPKSVRQANGVGAQRKFITEQLKSQLTKRAGEWKLVKKAAPASEATRLRKQAEALGLKLAFVSTSVDKVISAGGKSYYRSTGDIYVRYVK